MRRGISATLFSSTGVNEILVSKTEKKESTTMELLQQLISVLKSFPRDDNEVSRLLQNALRDSSLRDFHPQLIAVSRLSSQTPDISLATRSPKPSPCPPRSAQDDYSSEQQQHEGSNSLFLSCSVLPARISSLSGMQHSKVTIPACFVFE